MGTHTLRSTLETNTTLQTIVIMADISSTPTNFSGKRIIVTGGSSGIGKDAALSFHAAGATVVIMSRRQEVLDTIVAEEMGGERGFAVTMDAMDNASVEAGIKEAIEKRRWSRRSGQRSGWSRRRIHGRRGLHQQLPAQYHQQRGGHRDRDRGADRLGWKRHLHLELRG